jgi:hypothetical protein
MTKSGNFRLRYRYVHLTYSCHPPVTSPNSPADLSWLVSKLEENLATKGWTIGEHSACCAYATNSRLFDPPRTGPVTHIALHITGKDELRKFEIAAQELFQVKDRMPIIRVVTKEKHWKDVFAYHRREGGPLVQSGEPRPWAAGGIGPLPNCQYGGNYGKLCDENVHYDCPACFPRSFASSNRAGNLRADHTGHPVTARMVFLGSDRTYWFECSDCGHHFLSAASSVAKQGSWCPYCVNTKLCENPECQPCHIRSFASHAKASCAVGWNPRDFALNHVGKKPFLCDACAHMFEARLCNIAIGVWCPFCAGRARCKDLSCQPCHMRSFASHAKASCAVGWNPRDFALFYNGKMPFRCDTCAHHFEAWLYAVASGNWCPACTNKTQARVQDLLERTLYRVDFDRENTPRPSGRAFRLDWLVHTSHGPICIELDGRQHFRQIAQWGGSEALSRTRARDVYKMLYWLSRGARFIRLHQEDVFAERFDWRGALMHSIDVNSSPVVCLEAQPRDSWADLRAEVLAWWGKPTEAWLAQNAGRMDASAEDVDEEENADEG